MKTEKPAHKPSKLTQIRRLVGRNATRYSAGGREKRMLRPVPSLPKLKCLNPESDRLDSDL